MLISNYSHDKSLLSVIVVRQNFLSR